jgi:phosphoribosylanthranilate isomerase
MRKIIKVCGMRDPENIRKLIDLKPDMIGMIFHPGSPRYVAYPEELAGAINNGERRFKLVGVFVDEDIELIRNLHKLLNFGYIQLHGNESPEYCGELKSRGFKLIKALGISDKKDLIKSEAYQGIADLLIFDTKTSLYGGSGKKFDWSLLDNYNGSAQFILSGGIGPEDYPEISNPAYAGVDLNSRFETSPGMKDIGLLSYYFKRYRDDK